MRSVFINKTFGCCDFFLLWWGSKLGSGAGDDGAQLSPGEILKWTRKRHELGEWSFPKLTQEEEDIKSKLVDFLNSRT